jgi:hypothetical protein
VSAHLPADNRVSSTQLSSSQASPPVTGLVGYVFLGGDLLAAGAGNLATTDLNSGSLLQNREASQPYSANSVQNSYPAQNPANLYQLTVNNYGPFNAILTSTIRPGTPFTTMWKANRWASDNPTIESLEVDYAVRGDLILAFDVTESQKTAWSAAHSDWYAVNFTMAEIMLPPEFTGYSRSNVVASYTNNYDLISLEINSREDFALGPYWRRLRVYADTYAFGRSEMTLDKMDDAPDGWLAPNGPFQFSPWKTFGNITFSLQADSAGNYPDEWYYIRVNDVTAPTIAGTYTMKFRCLYSPELGNVFFPYQNCPTVSVKGEIDPAVVTGGIRYGGNSPYYGSPVTLPGRVRAVGIADDPYRGVSTGRPVEARGYFDAASGGRFEIDGVAPGVYDVYASAAGYPEVKIAVNLKILKGQSYSFDGYLTPGVQIRGTVFSKSGAGQVPWFNVGSEGNIKIEIYRSNGDAQSMLPGGVTSKAVTWTPFDYGANTWSGAFYYSIVGWLEPGVRTRTGVGPANTFRVMAGMAGFDFQFGHEGYYGAPADMDGHVPGLDWSTSDRNGATWVSGIGPGIYCVRAWLYGYVQTEPDGTTFMPVTFAVSSIERPGSVYVPFDLRRSGDVGMTAYFHDTPGTAVLNSIGWGWYDRTSASYYRYLQAELVGGSSNYKNPQEEPVAAFQINRVGVGNSSYTILIRGFREFGLWYGYGRNYGIPAGFYTVRGWMWGYVEQVFEKVSLGLYETGAFLTSHMYRGAKFNITVSSKDGQHPTADKMWSFPYMPIYVQIAKDGKLVAPSTYHWIFPQTMQGWGNTSAAVWPYLWNNGWMMVETNDEWGQVFGPDSTMRGRFRYFGPSQHYAEANGREFRYYDGSESYMYTYYWGSSYGQGSCAGYYPLSFESGVYDFRALTYGYVQVKPVQVYAAKGAVASDISIALTQGARIKLTLRFRHQGVLEGIPFDAHVRVRVVNSNNRVVGEFLSSDWWWQPQYDWTTGTNGTLRYTWNLARITPPSPVPPLVAPGGRARDMPQGHQNYVRLNYIPAGTTEVAIMIAGLPDMYNWVSGLPCDLCAATGAFKYDSPDLPAPYGIDAYPSYTGNYRLQIHVVPVFDYYPGHKYNPIEASRMTLPGIWPVAPANPLGFESLLTGELTYTPQMNAVYTNHEGPYGIRYDVIVSGMALGGESSLVVGLDR